MTPNQLIAPEALKKKLDGGEPLFLLDVRETSEYDNWHIPGSVNIPMDSVRNALGQIPKNKEIIAICAHGMRSEHARRMLDSMGYHVQTMEGGMVAWNRVYDIVEVQGETKILQFRRIGKGCLSYMAISSGEAVVIDPTIDAHVYIDAANERNARIIAAADTHIHADHVSGGRELADLAECRYFAPGDTDMPHEGVSDGTLIQFGSAALTAKATPGHTPESMTYLLEDVAFTGDTLFVESVGRPDLGQDPAPNAAVLWATLRKLLMLPERTRILPAHYGEQVIIEKDTPVAASIADLKRLPALQMAKEKFVQWISESTKPKPSNFEIIKDINKGYCEAEREDVYDLEAGPNRCSVA